MLLIAVTVQKEAFFFGMRDSYSSVCKFVNMFILIFFIIECSSGAFLYFLVSLQAYLNYFPSSFSVSTITDVDC